MYVFLPNENNDISSLLHKFGSDSDFFDHHIPQEKVNVGLFLIPKFKISFGFEGTDILKELVKTCMFQAFTINLLWR